MDRRPAGDTALCDELKSSSSRLAKSPLLFLPRLLPGGMSDGLFWAAGVDLCCFFPAERRILEHRCPVLLQESDFRAWSGKKKVVFLL